MANSAEERFAQLGLQLPPAPPPVGVYKPCIQVGNILYISGHGPIQSDGGLITGCVGKELDKDQGKQAAQQVGLAILATLKANLGSLDKIKRVVKTLGMVYSTPEFSQHPYVINGCSELFAKVWGNDLGVGARSAVGVGSLPSNISVEIEVIFELQ